jgi:hypothetical protein
LFGIQNLTCHAKEEEARRSRGRRYRMRRILILHQETELAMMFGEDKCEDAVSLTDWFFWKVGSGKACCLMLI